MSLQTYREATFDAMREEMLRDGTIYAIAEDINGNGGAHGRYSGLGAAIGDPERVIDAPISEAIIVGSAVGAAMSGLRPIVDLRFSNCLPCAMDEIVNQAAKSRYMFGGQAKVPMVIRAPDGILKMQGAHHTDCLEAWFTHVPGLQVVVPSTPAEGKGLLKTAIRNDNPVLFFEHKKLMEVQGEVPEGDYTIEFGKARIARMGGDITIVVYGIMVSRALEAAQTLSAEGIEAEVIDLRTLSPWDKQTVLDSVKKTGRALVAHEAVRQSGFGAEISATIAEQAFAALKAPVVRIGAPFVPIPMAPNLEDLCRVLPQNICEGARAAMQS